MLYTLVGVVNWTETPKAYTNVLYISLVYIAGLRKSRVRLILFEFWTLNIYFNDKIRFQM